MSLSKMSTARVSWYTEGWDVKRRVFQSCNEENESGTTRFSNERGFRKYILCWGFVAVPKSAEAKILNVRDVPFPSFKFYRQKLRVRTRLPESLIVARLPQKVLNKSSP